MIQNDIEHLTVPCNHAWLMARIASLLHPYYAGSAPQSSIEMMAEDWAIALGKHPKWAIDAAVRWWKSRANMDRKRKPLEGDIEARVFFEMGNISLAKYRLEMFRQGQRPQEPTPIEKRVTPEQRAAILAEKDFDDKRGFRKRMTDS